MLSPKHLQYLRSKRIHDYNCGVQALAMQTVAGQLMRPHGRRSHARPSTHCQVSPSLDFEVDPGAAPSTPKERLRARKVAEADRRMREITLQIHTTAHEKARVRERKHEMLQGTAQRGADASRAPPQQRSRSYHGTSPATEPAPDASWSVYSPSGTAVRPKSASGLMQHAAGGRAGSATGEGGSRRLEGRPSNSLLPHDGRGGDEAVLASAVFSNDNRLAGTGATTYTLPPSADEEELWAEENNMILAGDADEGMASRGAAAASGSRPQDWLPELRIPRLESAGAPATPTTAPSTALSTQSTPVRFGMDTLERQQFSEVSGGVGSPSAVLVSPLRSPMIQFGTGVPSDGGFVFGYRQTSCSPASAETTSASIAKQRAATNGGMSPLAQAAQARATSSTDYSEEYSAVRTFVTRLQFDMAV